MREARRRVLAVRAITRPPAMLQRKKVSILLETGAKGKGQVKQSCILPNANLAFCELHGQGLP